MAALLENWVNKNIWDFSKKSVGPTYDLKGTEARTRLIGYDDNFTDEYISERRAHQLAAVYTCINVRAQTVASLPINVIREKNGKKEVLTDHPAYYPLAQQPNNFMSSANLMLTSMIHSDSWGNSLVGINRDGFERPSSLEIINYDDWSVTVSNGEAWYKIRGILYPSRDVLHFRWFSLDGVNGISPIRQNAMTLGKAMKAERYSGMSLGSKPPGVLSYDGEMKEETKAQNQKTWKENQANGETPVLSGRWTYTPIMIDPRDAQYIETENLTDRRIYGIFRIPPVFAQDYQRATFKNAEESDLIFAKHTITPIIRIMEQECNMKLFTEREKKNTFVKYNLNGLLRGDIQARAAFYTAMRNVGGLNGNEIRDMEDMNSYEGGEIFTTQGANIPIDQLRDFYSKEVLPSGEENLAKYLRDNGIKMNGKFN